MLNRSSRPADKAERLRLDLEKVVWFYLEVVLM